MKKLLLAGSWLLGASFAGVVADSKPISQDSKEAKNESVGRMLTLFYNHLDSIEKHTESKTIISRLIEKYQDDPLLYELWCAVEWSSISLELEMKLDERRDIMGIAPYRKRAEQYHQMVARGLQLADQFLTSVNDDLILQRQGLFAKGALFYADAKFLAKFEDGLTGLRKADEVAAQGIKEFKKLLLVDKDFLAVHLYLGSTRYQISSQNLIKRTTIRFTSYSFAEINTICERDVVDKEEAILWIQWAYTYGAPELWLKKNWIESAFVLRGAYEKHRIDKSFGLSDEIQFIQNKEWPVLLWLLEQFPENKKLLEKHRELNLRLQILRNYLKK